MVENIGVESISTSLSNTSRLDSSIYFNETNRHETRSGTKIKKGLFTVQLAKVVIQFTEFFIRTAIVYKIIKNGRPCEKFLRGSISDKKKKTNYQYFTHLDKNTGTRKLNINKNINKTVYCSNEYINLYITAEGDSERSEECINFTMISNFYEICRKRENLQKQFLPSGLRMVQVSIILFSGVFVKYKSELKVLVFVADENNAPHKI
ncbi:hypothetical protein AGLY_006479 [Aphis glycines]|uniref:Uncharacterized protein n=1 Tax=Aphis glycines TaxID=307491 RepID=A0A6G0TRN4_APHGL|nr:hypothetical protein AGLY_006479 [Aphis glycines]